MMKKILVILMAVLALPVFILGATSAKADTFMTGDVFAGVNNGNIQWWRPSTHSLITTLNNSISSGGFTTGMAFDGSGNLYGTNLTYGSITKYDTSGAIITPNPFVNGLSNPESIAFSSGYATFYVGDPGTNVIKQFNTATGALLNSYTTVATGRVDWVDLAADNSTIYYTTEDNSIYRFDTATNTQMTNFVDSLPGSSAFALRILPGGGVLVADSQSVVKLDAAGNIVAQYAAAQSSGGLFSLNLDPDGTTFWTGDYVSGKFWRFDIATGALLDTFDTGTGNYNLFGLAIAGERTAPNVPIPPSALLFGSGLLGLVGWRRLRKA